MDKPEYNNKVPLDKLLEKQKERRLRETAFEAQDRIFMQAGEDIWKAFELACNEIENLLKEKLEKL